MTMPERRKGTPRPAATYRGARRNAARDKGLLGEWKAMGYHAAQANVQAALPKRRRRCAVARAVAVNAAAHAVLSGGHRIQMVRDALLRFWKENGGNSRATYRVMRELRG